MAAFEVKSGSISDSLKGVLRAISWGFALVSRTLSAAADGTRTRWPRVPAVRFEYEYHFIEYKYEKRL